MILSFGLLLVFIFFQGLFSGLETGMVSIRRPRIEYASANGSMRAKLVIFFLNRPGRMIAATLLGVNISVVCASLAAKSFAEKAGLQGGYGLLVLTCLLSVTFLISEIIPKSIFRQNPCKRCMRYVPLLCVMYFMLYLPVRLFDAFTSFLSRCFSRDGAENSVNAAVMREDMRLFLRESEAGGGMPPEVAELLDNVLASHSVRVSDIMTPSEHVTDISPDMTVDAAVRLCRRKNVNRLPVRRAPDDPVWNGVFSSFHIMFVLPGEEWKNHTVREFVQTLRPIDSNLNLIEALVRTKNVPSSLFVVTRGTRQIGVFTSADIARRLFV